MAGGDYNSKQALRAHV